MTCQWHPGNSTHTKPHRKHCVAVITIKNTCVEAFTTEQLKCRGYLLVMHSLSKTGAFHKQFLLVSASSDRRACFHSNQSGVLLAFFPPKLARFNSSSLQHFTMTQNLWGKFSKVKGWAGAWFSLTATSTWLLHVLLNISPNWLCKCLWKGGWRTGNPAGTCCSQYAHRAARNFCSELPNILCISASLKIWTSSQVCQNVCRDPCIFLQTKLKLWLQVKATRKIRGCCFFAKPGNCWQFGTKPTSRM